MLPMFPTPPGVARNPGKPILETPVDLEQALLAPFDPSDVDWKPGPAGDGNKALVFPYVDAAAIRARLTKVCGIGGWQALPYQIAPGQVGVALSIWIQGQWIVKADGAWSGDLDLDHVDPADKKAASKKADAIAKDAKGAISNALKRAAGTWGMGEYLRQLGRVYEEVQTSGWSKTLTPAAKERLYDLAAKPYYDHHARVATGHEWTAKKALAAGDLGSAFGAAKEALKVRHEVFGKDHETTARARTLFEDVRARQAAANGALAPSPPAEPSAPAAASPADGASVAPSNGQATAPADGGAAPGIDLRTIIDRLTAAGSVEEVRAAYGSAWKQLGHADTPDGIAFRNAIETAMQRFHTGVWTLAGAEAAAKARGSGATAPAQNGGAPTAARSQEGAAKGSRGGAGGGKSATPPR